MPHVDENDRTDELYKLYGMALHHCSNIEYRIAYLLLSPKWSALESITAERVREVYEELEKKPLGPLLKEYKSHFDLSERQLEITDELLEKRNYLTHRFFGSYGVKMTNPETIEEMIEELKDLVAFFQAISLSIRPERYEAT